MLTIILSITAVILAISTAVCAARWVGSDLAVGACMYYMKKKGYTLPSQEEIRACIKEVVRTRKSGKI